MANFDTQTLQQVWAKGSVDPNNDPAVWRKDQCGAWIRWDHYGDRSSKYGWEVDHITAVANGGNDALSNLRPLHWKNNVRTSDGRLSCPVTSSGNTNFGV